MSPFRARGTHLSSNLVIVTKANVLDQVQVGPGPGPGPGPGSRPCPGLGPGPGPGPLGCGPGPRTLQTKSQEVQHLVQHLVAKDGGPTPGAQEVQHRAGPGPTGTTIFSSQLVHKVLPEHGYANITEAI